MDLEIENIWANSKQGGQDHYQKKKKHLGQRRCYSRSACHHGKTNKARNLRKRADRHSHHRRRNHIRNMQAQHILGEMTIPRVSSTKACGNQDGHSWGISNRKKM